jgi:hypothetical protein
MDTALSLLSSPARLLARLLSLLWCCVVLLLFVFDPLCCNSRLLLRRAAVVWPHLPRKSLRSPPHHARPLPLPLPCQHCLVFQRHLSVRLCCGSPFACVFIVSFAIPYRVAHVSLSAASPIRCTPGSCTRCFCCRRRCKQQRCTCTCGCLLRHSAVFEPDEPRPARREGSARVRQCDGSRHRSRFGRRHSAR